MFYYLDSKIKSVLLFRNHHPGDNELDLQVLKNKVASVPHDRKKLCAELHQRLYNDDAFFLSNVFSPTFLLLSLVPHLCSLELLLPRSHYLSLLWPPPPSFSHLDSLLPPQSEYVFVHCTRIYSMLVLVCCNTCLTLITLKNLVAEVLGFQSMKYGMKGIFFNISLFLNAVKWVWRLYACPYSRSTHTHTHIWKIPIWI